MTELNFLAMHSYVVDIVVSKKAFKEILGKLNVGGLVKKAVQQYFEVENPDSNIPEPSTSQEFDGTKPKVQRTERGRGRGKGRGKRRGRGPKLNPTDVVQGVPVQHTQSVEKSDMTTQTDSDFEEYLLMSEQEFEEYQMYKELQMRQQYLVSTITEEDFQDYDHEYIV